MLNILLITFGSFLACSDKGDSADSGAAAVADDTTDTTDTTDTSDTSDDTSDAGYSGPTPSPKSSISIGKSPSSSAVERSCPEVSV